MNVFGPCHGEQPTGTRMNDSGWPLLRLRVVKQRTAGAEQS